MRAPTQIWSAQNGEMGAASIHGVYVSDVRVVRGLRVRVADREPEHLSTYAGTADGVRIDSLLRHLDTASPDPEIRLTLERSADARGMEDRLTVRNRHDRVLHAPIEIELDFDAVDVDAIKMDELPDRPVSVRVELQDGGSARWGIDALTVAVTSGELQIRTTASGLLLSAVLEVPARGVASVRWRLDAEDASSVVLGDDRAVPWSVPIITASDHRLVRWVDRALSDLDALRMSTREHPEYTFLAAGAPWFLTLFGRDAIWSARFMLPLGTRLAGDTLRVLAGLQGTAEQVDSAEEPGKIMHELRRQSIQAGDGVTLPPLYYGTVDATALWICLLHDAWRWGLPEAEVRALIPGLEAALTWMRDYGDADGDGLLEYIDRSGHGLANQGWKDSGDSVKWRDGSIARGPIALCEVQAYAYEAAMHGADLLEQFGRSGADGWREWARRLRAAFHERFWITDPDRCGALGPYPAVALDADKRPVDTITSNIGHLLGSGLLDDEQAALVASRLASPDLDSGFGLRTMSTDSVGYWPQSYHGGAVWTHDTAIAILGLVREGHHAVALPLVHGLLRAAEGFDYRMPELHSGDGISEVDGPIPYPAACRPQAWSAASAVAALAAVLGLSPNATDLTVSISPLPGAGAVAASGLRIGDRVIDVGIAPE